jgi:malate dehydrogenase (quinone)
MSETDFDIIIVGGGITGAALLYVLSNYTSMKKVLIIEKYSKLATLNSNSRNNAQTLHFGDIETNYTLEKSKETKKQADLVVRYSKLISKEKRDAIFQKCQKMVLGVNEEEIETLHGIKERLKDVFPGLKGIERKELEKLEPYVVKNRPQHEKVFALLSDNGYMVDFGKLTQSYIENSFGSDRASTHIIFDTRVKNVVKIPDGYSVITDKRSYKARFVIYAAGTYSLLFAKRLGYGKNLSILSIGGNFYITKRFLRGKVYRVQKGGIPFAAIHGDPDITDPNINRFGPTVTLPLELERRHNDVLSYLKTFDFDAQTTQSLFKILFNKDILRIIRKNMFYSVPVFGAHSFLKNEARVIVPSLKYSDLKLSKEYGGIRPQIIDERKRALVLGESKLMGDHIIFNITPSPGASSALANALKDVLYIAKDIDLEFNHEKFEKNFGSSLSKMM